MPTLFKAIGDEQTLLTQQTDFFAQYVIDKARYRQVYGSTPTQNEAARHFQLRRFLHRGHVTKTSALKLHAALDLRQYLGRHPELDPGIYAALNTKDFRKPPTIAFYSDLLHTTATPIIIGRRSKN
ncbi:hypothetical protein [Burkholderia ambifaria]|uniref:hypothetical protein n=1 Tax=Burkholderia ambifaria TaxID=152480 RepID=UPI0005B8AA29|nr:hypothetical protein [Burkholderia ambifaria]